MNVIYTLAVRSQELRNRRELALVEQSGFMQNVHVSCDTPSILNFHFMIDTNGPCSVHFPPGLIVHLLLLICTKVTYLYVNIMLLLVSQDWQGSLLFQMRTHQHTELFMITGLSCTLVPMHIQKGSIEHQCHCTLLTMIQPQHIPVLLTCFI